MTSEEYLKRGLELIEKCDYINAIKAYNEVINLDPLCSIAYYNRGIAYVRHGMFDSVSLGIQDLTMAIKLSPTNAEIYFTRGMTYLRTKDFDLAITDFQEAVKLNPTYKEANGILNAVTSQLDVLKDEKRVGFYIIENNFCATLLNRDAFGIWEYLGEEKDICIPSSIAGIKVNDIGGDSLEEMSLTSVIIPDSIESIGGYAFANNLLTSTTIPNSVRYIEGGSFENNPLKSITIGADVWLETGFQPAFDESFLYAYINGGRLAGTYTLIDDKWVLQSRDERLATPKEPREHYENGFMAHMLPDGTLEIRYGDYDYDGDFIVPSTITGVKVSSIGTNAFFEEKIQRVVIPENIINIGVGAFGFNNITKVTIGDNVKLDSSFENDFDKAYEFYGRKTGTYSLICGIWVKVK